MRTSKWIYCVFIIKKEKNAKSIYLDCGELDGHRNVADPQHEVGLLCNSREKDQMSKHNIKHYFLLGFSIIFTIYCLR